MSHSQETKDVVLSLLEEGWPVKDISKDLNIPKRTIRHWRQLARDKDIVSEETVDKYIRREQKSKQRLQDTLRITRKQVRQQNRLDSSLSDLTKQLIDVFKDRQFSDHRKHDSNTKEAEPVTCVLHLSDWHMNEIIDLQTNTYNIDVASKRAHKLLSKFSEIADRSGCTDVVILMSGDMIGSDRHKDELISMAGNRASALFVIIDFLQQMINNLANKYNVTVGGVCGNESRIDHEIGWVDRIASHSYDYVILKILEIVYTKSNLVHIIPPTSPHELVVNIQGKNILVTHGHSLSRTASTAKIESEVQKLIARYSSQHEVRIDYVIMGHIHSAYISNFFSRSASLSGGNAYSQNGLNLNSRASQNVYAVSVSGIDGTNICLQEYDSYEGFKYDKRLVIQNTSSFPVEEVVHFID